MERREPSRGRGRTPRQESRAPLPHRRGESARRGEEGKARKGETLQSSRAAVAPVAQFKHTLPHRLHQTSPYRETAEVPELSRVRS
ncbi:hypothetical protein FKM82_022846 [Ascaphus truei]